ncbi:MAG TPA: hypothetical protein PLK76_03270 [bacterium]|nr:hypothetical protein [bacterium]
MENSKNSNGRSIQVSGLKNFAENEWRKAVLYYLFGVWKNMHDVAYRPKISFDGQIPLDCVSLRLDKGESKYYALAGYQLSSVIPSFYAEDVLCVSSDRNAVEMGLVRFAKDKAIRMLKIDFGEGKVLALWKHRCRGQYSFAGQNLDGF